MVIEMRRIVLVAALCAGVVGAAGCSDSTTPGTPTNPTAPVATSSTQVMTGDVLPGATPLHTFNLPGTAPLHVLLGSLVGADGLPLPSTVTLTFGVPNADATVCNPLKRASTPVALRAQINLMASPGAYCVGLEDTSGVPAPFHYAIRVIYGTPSDETSSGTIDYSSTVLPGGATARSFGAATDGTATITMVDFSPASVATLGMGVGFQRNDQSGCEVSAVTFATRGAQLSVPVDAGKYCVKVFDPGTLTGLTAFTIKILHP